MLDFADAMKAFDYKEKGSLRTDRAGTTTGFRHFYVKSRITGTSIKPSLR